MPSDGVPSVAVRHSRSRRRRPKQTQATRSLVTSPLQFAAVHVRVTTYYSLIILTSLSSSWFVLLLLRFIHFFFNCRTIASVLRPDVVPPPGDILVFSRIKPHQNGFRNIHDQIYFVFFQLCVRREYLSKSFNVFITNT